MNAAKSSCYAGRMNSQLLVETLSGSDLLARTRDLARQSCVVEAELLVHLAEIDERKLYLDCALPSMFAFCVEELGFSEDAAYYRIHVARAGRQMPAIIDAIRTGKIHLAGARLRSQRPRRSPRSRRRQARPVFRAASRLRISARTGPRSAR